MFAEKAPVVADCEVAITCGVGTPKGLGATPDTELLLLILGVEPSGNSPLTFPAHEGSTERQPILDAGLVFILASIGLSWKWIERKSLKYNLKENMSIF